VPREIAGDRIEGDAFIPRPVFADYGYVRDRERVIPL
jgi:hypothetical protein